MATVEIKFIFDEYEDSAAIEILNRRNDYYNALTDISTRIRNLVKHSDKEMITIDELVQEFNNIIEANKIDLNL